MTIKEFIEAAIQGGWRFTSKEKFTITSVDTRSTLVDDKFYIHYFTTESNMFSFHLCAFLLDPPAWAAVGRVKGWNSREKQVVHVESWPYEEWEAKMLGMVHALLKGQTLEEYIATL